MLYVLLLDRFPCHPHANAAHESLEVWTNILWLSELFFVLDSGTSGPETVAFLAVGLTDGCHCGCTLYYPPVIIALAFWHVNHCKAF